MVTIDENQWFLYHAWRWGQVGAAPGRTLNLDLVKWSDDGWPHIGTLLTFICSRFCSNVSGKKKAFGTWFSLN